jgi:hypothetical protein
MLGDFGYLHDRRSSLPVDCFARSVPGHWMRCGTFSDRMRVHDLLVSGKFGGHFLNSGIASQAPTMARKQARRFPVARASQHPQESWTRLRLLRRETVTSHVVESSRRSRRIRRSISTLSSIASSRTTPFAPARSVEIPGASMPPAASPAGGACMRARRSRGNPCTQSPVAGATATSSSVTANAADRTSIGALSASDLLSLLPGGSPGGVS